MNREKANKGNLSKLFQSMQALKEAMDNSSNSEERDRLVHDLELYQSELEALTKAQETLEESRNLYSDLYNLAPVGYVTVTGKGHIQEVNQTGAAMLGSERSDLIGKPFNRFVAKDDIKRFRTHLSKCKKATHKVTTQVELVQKDGNLLHVQLVSGPAIRKGRRGGTGYPMVMTDIVKQGNVEEALLRLEKAMETTQLGITITDTYGKILYTNPADAEMHGYRVEELIGKDVRIFSPRNLWKSRKFEGKETLKSWRRETQNIRKDGSILPVQLISEIVTDTEGDFIGVVTTCEDITERKEQEQNLIHRALHDPLTNLPNRALLMDRLELAFNRAQRQSHMFAVLYLDLDHFKIVNDTLGHAVGDQLLIAFGRKMKEILRPGDTVARLGGDEFTILLDEIHDLTEAINIAARIHRELQLPFSVCDQPISATASIGIAFCSSRYDSPESILHDADKAMYRAKILGRARFEYLTDSPPAQS